MVEPTAVRVAHVTTVDMSLRYLLLSQLNALRSAGYDVSGISAAGPHVRALEADGFRHHDVPLTRRLTPLRDLSALLALVRVMRRERFDIVHTHTPKAGLLGQIAARIAGVPIVVNTVHGFYFHEHTPVSQKAIWVALEWIAGRCSDLVLSQNAEDMETAIRYRIVDPSRIQRLGNGIDITRFSRDRLDGAHQAELRRSLHLEPDHRVIGFVGRLVAEKGILELLEAAQIVQDRAPNARFLLIGPAEDKGDAVSPELAKKLGVERTTRFLGMRDDMPELYGLMDVFVLPSHREGFPRSPMEASAMGVPSIVTDVRGCREVVTPGENGVRVPLRDARSLADAIIRLLENDAERESMGTRARALAEEHFDERKIHARVLSEYEKLICARSLRAVRRTATTRAARNVMPATR